MRLTPAQLGRHLQQGLLPIYLVAGDEPLLVDEACALVRSHAQAQGFSERQVLTVESGFDWNGFAADLSSPSLFAARSLYELRLPTGKPGESGAKTLVELAARPAPDSLLVVITGKLDKAAQQSKWVTALESAGALVTVWPLEAARLPEWIGARLRARGVRVEPGVTELLAHYTEGNLLASAQEVDKLALLFGDETVTVAGAREAMSDDARFSVYGLVDACLAGEPASILRILTRLRAEGTEPILVLWALAREVRSLAQMAAQLEQGKGEAAVLDTFRVWPQRKALVGKGLKRMSSGRWLMLLARAARLDKVVKGRLPGDVWHELEVLALGMAGIQAMKAARRGRDQG
jgi:DNA polymerase-3 subunit delta